MIVVVVAWPGIDASVSGLFADGRSGFPLRQDNRLSFFNDAVLSLSRLGAALLLALAVLSGVNPVRSALRKHRRAICFLALAYALGPGLIVNVVLKEEIGRARPVRVEQFGGDRSFSPAFVQAQECDRNCSFPSGHVAASMLIVGGSFIARRNRRRRWLVAGLAFAFIVGFARIAVGAHFLSDVLVSMAITWFALILSAAIVLGPSRWRYSLFSMRSMQ